MAPTGGVASLDNVRGPCYRALVNSHDADNPRWHLEQERPFDSEALAALAEDFGPVEHPSSKWSGLEVDEWMQHVLRVAAAELTDDQLSIFVAYYVQHRTQAAIAAERGCSVSAVQQSLHGIRRKDGWWREDGTRVRLADRGTVHNGGSVAKIKAALENDAPFKEAVAAAAADKPNKALEWWRTSRPPHRAHLAGPLLLLFVMDELADAKGELRVEALFPYLPGEIVNGFLSKIKALGWVATDGVTARILQTPIHPDPERRIR